MIGIELQDNLKVDLLTVYNGLDSFTQECYFANEPSKFLESFDLMLQYTLLKMMVVDDVISKEEINYIKSVSENGFSIENLIETRSINKKKKLVDYTIEELKTALSDLEIEIVGIESIMAITFKRGDKALKKVNYFERIYNNIYKIIEEFSEIDGKKTKREIEEGFGFIKKHFFNEAK